MDPDGTIRRSIFLSIKGNINDFKLHMWAGLSADDFRRSILTGIIKVDFFSPLK